VSTTYERKDTSLILHMLFGIIAALCVYTLCFDGGMAMSDREAVLGHEAVFHT